MTIWKIKLQVEDEQTIRLPAESRILSVGAQDGDLCLWALVNPDNQLWPTTILIRGTGNPCDGMDGARFIGTVMRHDVRFVAHVFVKE